MSLVAPGGTFMWPWLPMTPNNSAPVTAGYTAMTASGFTTSFVFEIPASGTIAYLGFRCVASTTGVVTVGLQTVNSSGQPTGTAYGGSAASANQSIAANTPYEVALGTPATATQGDLVALVFTYVSGTTMTIGEDYVASFGLPFMWSYNGSTYTATRAIALATLGYSSIGGGGSGYVPIFAGSQAIESYATNTFNSGSATTRRALKVTAPWDMTVVGAYIAASVAASGSLLVNLRNASDTSLTSVTTNSAQAFGTTGTRFLTFPSPVNLTNGSVYRLSLEPQNTNNVSEYEWTFSTLSYQYANPINNLPGGTDAVLSTYTSGAWTDVTNKRPMCGLLVSAVPQSASSGGAFVPMPMGVM